MNPEERAKQFDKVNWNIKHKMRKNWLQIDQPPPLSLGAPKIDNDLDKIRQAKESNSTYSSKEIYFDILEQSVPLYKFKDFYSVDDLSSRFSVDELEELKTTYLRDGVPDYEFFEYMDELIKYAKENEAEEAAEREEEERQQLALLKPKKKCPGCSILGGKLKNAFRKKNKSKRVNKRIKKNKRYSRKSFKII